MPFLLAEILNFQGSTHHIGVGSFSNIFLEYFHEALNNLFDEHTLFLYELMCVRYF